MRLDGLRLERATASKQYRDGHFHNTSAVMPGLKSGTTSSVLREFLFGGKKRKPPGVIPVASPLETWAKNPSGLRVTWLGHSTMLIESDGVRVLTDPVFGDRLGPVSFMGPKRFHETPVAIEQLPDLDAVLVSHDHYDHLCKQSVIALAKRGLPFITSLGVGAHLEKFGIPAEQIVELDWWEQHVMLGGELAFTATPAQHFSGRIGSGRNTTLWASWQIRTPAHNLFFSGDTGLHEGMREIAARLGPFDLTMLEIGAWHPAWGDIHLGPENALSALELLGGGTLLPVHWSTFDLGLHPWSEPAEQLIALAAERNARVLTPQIGAPFEPAQLDGPVAWWRDVAPAVTPPLLPLATPTAK